MTTNFVRQTKGFQNIMVGRGLIKDVYCGRGWELLRGYVYKFHCPK